MDIALFVLLVAGVGLLVSLASAAYGYEVFAWFMCLPTSIAWLALPLVMAPYLPDVLEMFTHLFQPNYARAVLNLSLILCMVCGAIGIVICFVTAVAWFRRLRHVAKS